MHPSRTVSARILACLALAALAGAALADGHPSDAEHGGASGVVNDVHEDLRRIHGAVAGTVHDHIAHTVEGARAVHGHVVGAVQDHVAKTVDAARAVHGAVSDHVSESVAKAAAHHAASKERQQKMVAAAVNHVADSAEAMRAAHSNMRAAAGDHVRQAVNHVADSAEAMRAAHADMRAAAAGRVSDAHQKFTGHMTAALEAMAGAAEAWHEHVRATHERAMDVGRDAATKVQEQVGDTARRAREHVHAKFPTKYADEGDDGDANDAARRRLLESAAPKSFAGLAAGARAKAELARDSRAAAAEHIADRLRTVKERRDAARAAVIDHFDQ